MAEVASNIESRTTFEDVKRAIDSKVDRNDFQFVLQQKVNFEEMKNYVDQVNTLRFTPAHENLEEEIRRMRKRVDDSIAQINAQVQPLVNKQGSPSSSDLQRLEQFMGKRLSDVEEQLNDKASKSSVAQALHRKINKNEYDDSIIKKADLSDINRLIQSIDQKVEISAFEKLMQTVNAKADKFEVQSLTKGSAETLDKSNEKFLHKFEFENKVQDLDDKLQRIRQETDQEMESLRTQVMSSIQTKADYRDLDQIGQKIHMKMDIEKAQSMIVDIKNDLHGTISDNKQAQMSVGKDIDDEVKKLSNEFNSLSNQNYQEIGSLQDKLQRLAAQFDKELVSRDKQIKTFKSQTLEDFQRHLQVIISDIDLNKQKLNDMDIRKADKKELLDFKQKTQPCVDAKMDRTEVQSLINDFTQDQSQKSFNFRKELFEKISDIQKDISQSVSQFVQISELNQLLESKADRNQLMQLNQEKVTVTEMDAIRKAIDRLAIELEAKPSFKELEAHATHQKAFAEDISKDLMLKASVKDLCQLLDQKVNVMDMNQTLSVIQTEVEKCVRDQELKKALTEQALVNEALCAENCVGRWIWKSGDLYHKNQVPWEVQAINTCPDNFLWEKNKSSLICVAPGLYQVSFGFYSKKDPMIQIYLNGEPLMTASKQKSLEQKPLAIQSSTKHPAGNVTGLTHVDYIALPARGRLSLVYSCESYGEGFICLRKL